MPEQATAAVATATPARYAKQLASHFGRRCEISTKRTYLVRLS